jgi:hypothetical protein
MIRLRLPQTAARVIADLDRVLSAGYLSRRVPTGILGGLCVQARIGGASK